MLSRSFSLLSCLWISLFVTLRLQPTFWEPENNRRDPKTAAALQPIGTGNRVGVDDSPPSATPLRLKGELALPHLPSLPYCINYQIRGHGETILTSEQAHAYLQNLSLPLRTLVVTVEDPNRFISLTKHAFHFYLFLEFLVLAFAEVQASIQHLLHVTAWYTPLMTQDEICGNRLNCHVLQYVLGNHKRQIAIHGLESNSAAMMSKATTTATTTTTTTTMPAAYRGQHLQRYKFGDSYEPLSNADQDANHATMLNDVDVLLLIHREQCQGGAQNYNKNKNNSYLTLAKMWRTVAHFPALAWYKQVQAALVPQPTLQSNQVATSRRRRPLVVGYIDRQNTDRRIPQAFHAWLVQYLQQLQDNDGLGLLVEFYHLHMEDYPAATQVQMASSLDVMIGVHGNGLSHQVWMKPGSFVMEFYWDEHFRYSYPLAAQLWNHTYAGLCNGRPLDATRIQQRDPGMTVNACPSQYPAVQEHWDLLVSQEAVREFVQAALDQRMTSSE